MSKGQLAPASAISAAAALAGSRSGSGLREMMMIAMLAMMSSPAVASWTRAQRKGAREKEGEEEGFHRGGMEKWTLKNKSSEVGSREETWRMCFTRERIWITAPSHILGGEMNRGQR